MMIFSHLIALIELAPQCSSADAENFGSLVLVTIYLGNYLPDMLPLEFTQGDEVSTQTIAASCVRCRWRYLIQCFTFCQDNATLDVVT